MKKPEVKPFQLVKMVKHKTSHLKLSKTWTLSQMINYTIFLQDYLEKKSGIALCCQDFKNMAKVVRSRNTNQCRIFHGRLIKIHKSLQDIFLFFSRHIDNYDKNSKNIRSNGVISQNETEFIKDGANMLSKNEGCQKIDALKDDIFRQEPYSFEEKIQKHSIMMQAPILSSIRFDWMEDSLDYFIENYDKNWLDFI